MAEVGQTIIDRATGDTVESLGSGTALTRLAGEDAESVTARAQAGDPDAVRYMAEVAGDFAIGVFNMVHLFAPQRVVIVEACPRPAISCWGPSGRCWPGATRRVLPLGWTWYGPWEATMSA